MNKPGSDLYIMLSAGIGVLSMIKLHSITFSLDQKKVGKIDSLAKEIQSQYKDQMSAVFGELMLQCMNHSAERKKNLRSVNKINALLKNEFV